MGGYAAKVKQDVARWAEAGLIGQETAAALTADIERHSGRGISLGTVLATMAAILMSAALLIFIAANWDAIPRLVRIGGLFILIAAGYVGGAALKSSGRSAAGEALWLIAAAGFGASLALVGQMYHISGDERQAIFTWGVGTAIAALFLRSPVLTIGAVLLATLWMAMMAPWPDRGTLYILFLAFVLLWALSFWTASRPARHLLVAALCLFVILQYLHAQALAAPIALAVAAAALFAFAWIRPDLAERWTGLGHALPTHALLLFMTGLGIIQIDSIDEPELVLLAIIALAAIVGVLLLAGRGSALLRRTAYALFAGQLGFLYVVTLGSMLGTSGFFFTASAVLALLALLIARLERRLTTTQTAEAA